MSQEAVYAMDEVGNTFLLNVETYAFAMPCSTVDLLSLFANRRENREVMAMRPLKSVLIGSTQLTDHSSIRLSHIFLPQGQLRISFVHL